MNSDTRESITKVITADSAAFPHCPICSGLRPELFHALLLNKHQVHYLYCDSCGLLQTEELYWFDEAYVQRRTQSKTFDDHQKITGRLF